MDQGTEHMLEALTLMKELLENIVDQIENLEARVAFLESLAPLKGRI